MEGSFPCWTCNLAPIYTIIYSSIFYGLCANVGSFFKIEGVFHLITWKQFGLPKEHGGLSIQSLVIKRQALLAAHPILYPNSQWLKVICVKYQISGWVNYKKPPSISGIWTKICAFKPKVQYNFMWSLVDGFSVNVLSHPWFSMIPLRAWPIYLNMSYHHEEMMVSNLMLPNKTWNVELISDNFPAKMMKLICTIPVPCGAWPDLLCWSTSNLYNLAIKDMYPSLWNLSSLMMNGNFKWAWKLQVPLRVKMFWWKKLPTKFLLNKLGFLSEGSSNCDLCNEPKNYSHMMVHEVEMWHKNCMGGLGLMVCP